ncbi:MAG: glycosyltransferase [Candidatus Latescibacterota bacterium]
MRVLVTSRLYPSAACPGRGTFVHNQVRFLAAHCELEVISPTPWSLPVPGTGRYGAYARVRRHECLDGIAVSYPRYLSPPRRVLFSHAWRFYLAAVRRAQVHRPDLVHAHLAYPDGYAGVHLSRALGVPLVISVHGHDVRQIPQANPRWRALVEAALAQAAAVIGSSTDILGRLASLGVPDSRVHRVPQGVDSARFCLSTRQGPGSGDWRLLYLGRFDQKKGIGVLLEAVALLRQEGRRVHLRLVGGSPISGTGAAFRRQAALLGLEECVEFGSEKPPEAIPAEIGDSDLLVLPSFYDSFGIVLIEAMACGVPVVATRCGGPEDIVEPEVGELVTPGSVLDLARGIGNVLDGYARYDRQAIRERAVERYDYRSIAARIHGIYGAVLQEAAGAGTGG